MRILPAPLFAGSESAAADEPKDLPSHLTLLESALPRRSSHNLFLIRTYAAHSDVREAKNLQAQGFIDNSSVINTYERPFEVRETQGL